MIKTAIDIERDFFVSVKASALGAAIHGDVYYREMRPADAKTEDIIVKFLAGLDEQVQTGVIILNIYVADIAHGSNGRMVENRPRVAELMTLIRQYVEGFDNAEYAINSGSTPKSVKAEGISQHIITARVNFKRITL